MSDTSKISNKTRIKRIGYSLVAICVVAMVTSLTLIYGQNQINTIVGNSRFVVVERQPNQSLTPPSAAEVEEFDHSNAPKANKLRKIAAFTPGRNLLAASGFPFEPYILLENDWRSRLAQIAGQMPAMQAVRRADVQLSGVQIANTLTIPSDVELTGDTVIIADRIIYEGHKNIEKGNYNLYIFDKFLNK